LVVSLLVLIGDIIEEVENSLVIYLQITGLDLSN
jgi:hypothetical protein